MICLNPIAILPDETIYSYLARLHGLWGESNHRMTSQRWLGKSGASVDQRLPVGLEHLSEKAGISVDKLLYEHTCYPLFAAYATFPLKLKLAMLTGHAASIANLSNVAQSRLRQFNQHRFCSECLEEDLHNYGVGYWHLAHQFSGVSACIVHGATLDHVPIKSSRQFHLPSQIAVSRVRKSATCLQVRFAAEVIRCNNYFKPTACEEDEIFWLDSAALCFAKNLSRGRNIDMQGILTSVQSLSFELFDDENVLTEPVLRGLLGNSEYRCHPIKAILLNFALNNFLSRPRSSPKHVLLAKRGLSKERCERLLIKQCYSLREIARRTKRSVGFVKSLSGKVGLHFQRRTQFITPDITARIKELAIAGVDRKVIATDENVSVGAVEQIIQSVKGLSEYRQYLRMLGKQNKCRQKLLNAIGEYPHASRKQLKSRLSPEYTWLYKYDNAWLNQVLPPAIQLNKRRG